MRPAHWQRAFAPIRAASRRDKFFLPFLANTTTDICFSLKPPPKALQPSWQKRARIPAGFQACPLIAVNNTRLALGRVAHHYRNDFRLPVITVGGSNGKTTTKDMIASVLRQAGPALWSEASFNNDIGVPLTLLQLRSDHRAAVVEAGTNHPGELAQLLRIIEPSMGLITNIGREHLEYFHDLDGVANEEGTIAEMIPVNGTVFLNGDDPWTLRLASRASARVLRLGLADGNDWRATHVQFNDSGVSFSVTGPGEKWNGDYRVRLLGRHQVANALFAIAIGANLGLDREQIVHGLAECAPAKMRLQIWENNGLRVIEDCYNANADSMTAAIRTLAEMPCANRRIAVLGDMGELGDQSQQAHWDVGRQAASAGLDQLITVGPRATGIAAGAREHGFHNIIEAAQVEAAAQWLREHMEPGDLVLIKASRSMRFERLASALRQDTATLAGT